jgi:hypothetical protein
MAVSSDDGAWLNPKWLVTGVALAAFGLILSYDIRLGIAAGALLVVVAAVWLYLALRYGSLSGAPSGRRALVTQVRQQMDNRRVAAGRSGTQQGPDLTEGT